MLEDPTNSVLYHSNSSLIPMQMDPRLSLKVSLRFKWSYMDLENLSLGVIVIRIRLSLVLKLELFLGHRVEELRRAEVIGTFVCGYMERKME